MSHTLLGLNYDVLSNILTLISPHDAAQLALASRAAYALAFPRFLSDVSLGGLYHKPGSSAVSQLKTFCNFALAPAPSWNGAATARLDGLHTLEIMRDAVRVRQNGMRVVDASAVALLSSVLERAHNLQKLTLWGSDALFAACPDFGAGSNPSIHTLVLGGDIAPLPSLARAFPHIRSLKFIAGGGACVPDWAFQAPESDVEALGPWRRNLEHVDAGFPIVPLACPVRRVDLRNPIAQDMDSIVTAHTFLSKTRPVVLSASVSTHLRPEEVGTLLSLTGPSLRYLNLVGDRCEDIQNGAEWMNHVAQGLPLIPKLSLLGIKLSLTAAVVPSAAKLKPQPSLLSLPDAPTSTPTPAPQQTEPVDLTALARSVAESAPSLQFVEIDLSAVKGERAWFGVRQMGSGAGNVRRIRKLSEREGLAVAARMRGFNRYD